MARKTIHLLGLLIFLWPCGVSYSADSEALPVKVEPTDPKILFMGRFDTRQSNPRCAWPGSSIIVRFNGTAINAVLSDTSKGDKNKNGGVNANYISAIIDDGQPMVFALENGRTIYRVGDKLAAGDHMLVLFKRTESFVGVVEFKGLELSEGGRLIEPPAQSNRRIEFIGDSITCGYGNEAESEKVSFCALTENNYLAYGALTARHFGAEYFCIAWSGIGAYSSRGDTKNTMATRYDKILPRDPDSKWDFKKCIPDVVVVNLGTNDFAKGDPGENYLSCYTELLKTIRGNYPDAHIFCAPGSMLRGEDLNKNRDYVKAAMAKLNDSKIYFVEFEGQDRKNGFGADFHPNLKTHAIMANTLIKAVEEKTGWKAAAPAENSELMTKPSDVNTN